MVRIVGAFNNAGVPFFKKGTKHTKITKTIRTENNPKDIYIKK